MFPVPFPAGPELDLSWHFRSCGKGLFLLTACKRPSAVFIWLPPMPDIAQDVHSYVTLRYGGLLPWNWLRYHHPYFGDALWTGCYVDETKTHMVASMLRAAYDFLKFKNERHVNCEELFVWVTGLKAAEQGSRAP
eukprot:597064-Amphidinium_carterae.1